MKNIIYDLPKIISKLTEIFIYRKIGDDFKFLLLKRDKAEVYPEIWAVAGGEIEEGEKAFEAARREMQEETGLKAKQFYLVDTLNMFYEMDDDVIHIVPVFLAEANDEDVKLLNEHSEYKWMNFEEAYEKIRWIGWKNNIELIHKILNNEILFQTLRKIKV